MKHPKGFYFIFWGELAERASYYGMKAILALYMLDVLGFTKSTSGLTLHAFTATCYLLPLLGGYIADRWLGKFKTIIYFAIPYIAGHIILGTWDSSLTLYIALFLLAAGSGTIKPNISPLMGLMYDQGGYSHELRHKAFTWFYASINIGAAISMLSLPLLRDHYGYHVAFLFPTVLMAISLGIFYAGKRYYPDSETDNFVPRTVERSASQRAEDRLVIKNLSGVFVMIIFFWAIFDQAASTWVFFARDYMNLHGFAPDMIQGLNPILIILLAPLFNAFWDYLKKANIRVSDTDKMMAGFVLVTLCMAVMACAGWMSVDSHHAITKVSVLWEIGAFILVTAAELCISVVGLELAYTSAPSHMQSTVTAVFLLTVFVGNLLAGVLSSLYPIMAPGHYFGMLTVAMIIVSILFRGVARRFESAR